MQIRKIRINHWRHFENIELHLDDNVNLVCIAGANGTGKSLLLELIAACADRLGLSQGVDIPRGDPFSDPHDISLQFYLAEGVSAAVDEGLAGDSYFADWDRTLTVNSQTSFNTILAGGINNVQDSRTFANNVTNVLKNSEDVYFLSLDANRAYPKKNLNVNELAQAYEIDWSGKEYTRGRSSKPSATLYDEWIKYFLAQENQAGTELIQGIRRARQANGDEPTFTDHFNSYKQAVQKVLPHLSFIGVDPKKRTLLFDTTGEPLSFDQLSGGEREIAFLAGQIDRFGLREGLFLLDEPELHLNSDLIRTWVSFLTSTVQTGQVWLATHSLEAVESAGSLATFVLEKNEETRKVDRLTRLDTRPVLAVLSRAIGTPAFSISQHAFVFVEGQDIEERERFRKLAGSQVNVRFMECGGCEEVLRRGDIIRELANETDTGIRIGGIIDRDFRSDGDVTALTAKHSVFILPVHEVENYFLHPETLQHLLKLHGYDDLSLEIIRNKSDERAGSWIFQHAIATSIGKSLSDISVLAKESAKSLSWKKFEENADGSVQRIVSASNYDETEQEKLKSILNVSVKTYTRKRLEADLWKNCEGKQVLNNVARATGFSNVSALIQAVFAAWEQNNDLISEELTDLRNYLASL